MSDQPTWDAALVAAGHPHLLQSWRWGELQSEFGWRVERTRAAGAPVSLLTAPSLGARGRRFGYVARGPAAGSAAMPEALEELVEVVRDLNLTFLRVEPEIEQGWSPPSGWVQGPATQPEHTSILDISTDPAALLAGFKSKTRYNIRLAEKKGVEVELSDDIEAFGRLSKLTSARHGINLATTDYYRAVHRLFAPDDGCRLYLARHQGAPLAGIMVLRFGGRATYLFGASGPEGRHLMPAYLLHWRALQELHAAGDVEYDLWGLPPNEDPAHPWHGLWQFKSGWNGRFLAYAGAFDLPLDPNAWRAHRALSRIRVTLRRLRSRAH